MANVQTLGGLLYAVIFGWKNKSELWESDGEESDNGKAKLLCSLAHIILNNILENIILLCLVTHGNSNLVFKRIYIYICVCVCVCVY